MMRRDENLWNVAKSRFIDPISHLKRRRD